MNDYFTKNNSEIIKAIFMFGMLENIEVERHQKVKGTEINNYMIIKKIGEGSYSKVYLATDIESQKYYAIKCTKHSSLSKTIKVNAQFENEIKLLNSLNHKNIIKLHQALLDQVNNNLYLVLDYAENKSLEDVISSNQHLSTNNILSIIKQILLALDYIHKNGYVHQDIKPSNILISKNGRALLCDFGIAHSVKKDSKTFGSPAYQAPESLDDDEIDYKKTDVWSLGITFYQMLFHSLPFTGQNIFEIIYNVKNTKINIPFCLQDGIKELLESMLNKRPEKRLSVNELLKNPLIENASELITDIHFEKMKNIQSNQNKFKYVNVIKAAIWNEEKHSFSIGQYINSLICKDTNSQYYPINQEYLN